MKKMMLAIAATIVFGAAAEAMEGTFDRTAEVQKYLEIVATKSNGEMTAAAKEIYASGISDADLGRALNERILKDYAALKPSKAPRGVRANSGFLLMGEDVEYGFWMCRALSSMGMKDYADTFKQIARPREHGGANSSTLRQCADDALERIEWHKRKNELMSSRKYYNRSEDDMRAAQLMNLLTAEDPAFRRFALDRISQERIRDPQIYGTLRAQVLRHIDHSDGEKQTRMDDNLIATNIKLLGLSGDPNYKDVLQAVLSSNAVDGLKKHARAALQQLN